MQVLLLLLAGIFFLLPGCGCYPRLVEIYREYFPHESGFLIEE
jgi:hypothetical protein